MTRTRAAAPLSAPFVSPGRLEDAVLALQLEAVHVGDASHGLAPDYTFAMLRRDPPAVVGRVTLRVTDDAELELVFGHVGYRVDEDHRGHGYAARAVRLLLPLARRHGLRQLWATCAPENLPSRRTLQRVGFLLEEEVFVPEELRRATWASGSAGFGWRCSGGALCAAERNCGPRRPANRPTDRGSRRIGGRAFDRLRAVRRHGSGIEASSRSPSPAVSPGAWRSDRRRE